MYFVRDIKHLFYIIFCDFNFSGPELTTEITGYTVYKSKDQKWKGPSSLHR
jgi:hypothetical protein